ncbi:MAG: hypothetical protein FWE72_08295 [Spirochaetaceae bacterium]|nr:hypothetical protein [Spirochaetaceae bacterium]
MIKFVKNAFSGLLSLILWLNLILCTIAGGYSWSYFGSYNREFSVSGALIGFVAGLIINIVFGGLLATIINIDKNIEKIANKND